MPTARKTSSGKYRVRVYLYKDEQGKKHYKSFTAKNKKDAERAAAEYKAIQQNDINITFQEALTRVIDGKSNIISPKTLKEYRRAAARDFDDINHVKLNKLSQEIVQRHVNNYAKTHAPKTVRSNYAMLNMVLKAFLPDRCITAQLPSKVHVERHVPDDADIKKILEAVKGTSFELPVLLAAFGSMRRGEICALESSDIKGNIIHVHKSMSDSEHGWIIKETKSYAGDRYIVFPDFVVEKWQGIEGRLVNMVPSSLTNHFNRLLDKHGIPHFRFHDLRHYYASALHAMGIPDVYIMERGGWSSDKVLKDVYRHALVQEEEKTNQKINSYFEKMTQR